MMKNDWRDHLKLYKIKSVYGDNLKLENKLFDRFDMTKFEKMIIIITFN